MPIERYKVGRKYTERHRICVSGDSLGTKDGAAALTEAFQEMARGHTLEGRITTTVRWAESTLERAGMPLDTNAPIYSDPGWCRQNARLSAVWYAIAILETVGWLRIFRKRGDIDLALDFALDLGVLATEAKFAFGYMARTAASGGKTPKTEKEEQYQEWRRQAKEIWSRRPDLGVSAVATNIDAERWERVRAVIRPLNPNPRKSKISG